MQHSKPPVLDQFTQDQTKQDQIKQDQIKQSDRGLDQAFLKTTQLDIQGVTTITSDQDFDLVSSEDLEDEEEFENNRYLDQDLEEGEAAESELEFQPPDPEQMLILLKSDVILERMQAARAFCEIEEPRAIPDLIDLLTDDCALVRVSAAYALGRNPSFDAVKHLIRQLQTDCNGYVRKGVVWALGTCGDQSVLAPLISALRFDIAAVRLWAASALGQLGNIQAIAPLMQALQADKVDAVRSNCAWALGSLLSFESNHDSEENEETFEDAIDALIGALEDDDLGVRDDARLTLRKLQHPRGVRVLEKIELDQGFCDLF